MISPLHYRRNDERYDHASRGTSFRTYIAALLLEELVKQFHLPSNFRNVHEPEGHCRWEQHKPWRRGRQSGRRNASWCWMRDLKLKVGLGLSDSKVGFSCCLCLDKNQSKEEHGKLFMCSSSTMSLGMITEDALRMTPPRTRDEAQRSTLLRFKIDCLGCLAS